MNKNLLEWTVFGVSVALIAVVAGLLLHQHFTTGDRPADLMVVIGQPVASGGGYAVPVDIRNGGDRSAEDVHVSITLPGAEPEARDLTMPYVPYRSTRSGWVVFSRDPASARLEGRVLGYREP